MTQYLEGFYLMFKAKLYKNLSLLEVVVWIKSVIDNRFVEYKKLEHKDCKESY